MKIVLQYEINDRIVFKAPTGHGPLKFAEFVGVITNIVQHLDEENDMSSTVFVVNINETLYNISYQQIVCIDTHLHDFREICKVCGAWIPEMNPSDD